MSYQATDIQSSLLSGHHRCGDRAGDPAGAWSSGQSGAVFSGQSMVMKSRWSEHLPNGMNLTAQVTKPDNPLALTGNRRACRHCR